MEKFINLLLGNNDFPTFAAAMVLAFIGAIISLNLKLKRRNRLSALPPRKFSRVFFLQDNLLSLLSGIFPIYIAIRFSSELLGQNLTMLSAFFIGLGIDRIVRRFETLQHVARDKELNNGTD